MTYELMNTILTSLGIPYAYHHFKKPVTAAKYAAYFESDRVRFLADDHVYAWGPQFAVELYMRKDRDIALENQLIELFDQYDVVWSGGESTFIDSEGVYLTTFYC